MEKYKSRLAEIRKAAGLGVRDVAKGAGVSERTVILVEQESGCNPRVGTVKRLLKYLNVTFNELFPDK